MPLQILYRPPSRDLIYDLGLKENSVDAKMHATEEFYREHGMEGLLSLWLTSGANYIDYEIDEQRVLSWWLDPGNSFKERIREYLQRFNEQDAALLIQIAVTVSSEYNHPYIHRGEKPLISQEGQFDFIPSSGEELSAFISTYFPQYPELSKVTNPLFHRKSQYTNGYDDSDFSDLFICSNLVQGFENQPEALHYLSLKGRVIDPETLTKNPITLDISLVESLGLSPEEFYHAAIASKKSMLGLTGTMDFNTHSAVYPQGV